MKKPVRILSYNQSNKQILYATRNEEGVEVPGVLSPLREGVPISQEQEIVRLQHEKDNEWTMDTVYDPKTEGPTKVNSLAFHRGWDAIWGAKDQAN